MQTTKHHLAYRARLHAQAIAAGSDKPTGLHPLLSGILSGAMAAQIVTAEAVRAANEPINRGETSPTESAT